VPAARGYAGGFACDLMIKDLSLAASAAASSAPPAPPRPQKPQNEKV
jgi:3-hydroxyisobutyrate dehydrogenase-like beta-hydroxyacid dehydrogenase